MQTVIQVIATGTGSLRNKIMSDPQLEKKFGFIKVWHKQPGRPYGWAKINSARDIHGAINLEWHARSRTLICRVVTKLGNKPNSIIGDFVDYLLAAPKPDSCHPHHAAMNSTMLFRRLVRQQSLYRDALGEIARFIDVAAECDGDMIGQKLEWDDGENRHDVIRRFRQDDDVVSDTFEMFHAVAAGQRDDRSFASFHLLNVVKVF